MLNSNIIFKPIPNYEGLYEVSTTGTIRSVDRYVNHSSNSGKKVLRKGKTIVSNPTATVDYLYSKLYQNNKMQNIAVHRAVALAFLPNPNNLSDVNHIDGNKLNNNVCNLEWVTRSDNLKHAFASGLRNVEDIRTTMIGTRRSKHSNYRNVVWDKARSKWKGSIKHMGKMLPQKRFDTELEAAIYVNELIDTYGLNRPKNIIR